MNRIFGKKKAAAPAPSLGDASRGLDGRIESMDSKIAALDQELRVYKEKIKASRSPAARQQLQKRAMEVLKRKRMYEQQRDQAAGQQFNVDQAAFSIESAKATVHTVAALKASNMELKKTLRQDLNIDSVDDLADDMAELMDDFNEINEALGRNFATPDDINEADLDAELEMLGDELENDDYLVSSSTPSYLAQTDAFPATPQGIPSSATASQIAANSSTTPHGTSVMRI
jgi:charged multivesicular body protein 5